jgi:hypothetical protein
LKSNGARLNQCRLIEIPRFADPRGTLAVIEGRPLLPFDPKRFFYIYGVANGEQRAGHALMRSEELIIALAGSFTISLDDGFSKSELQLSRPDQGLYLPPAVWHVLHSFAPGSVCGVLASTSYDSDGYYTRYDDFIAGVRLSKIE